ncbi:hypothetical protein D9757_012071 [Collybiopsis confluens]|uniref:Cytochrome P450 n=1 Tax=Collybiopsis confluens TaxID=2823264 RepID=A0A8H5LLF7_9AGAR|nr:hypothetical protein D9757_012071 [Collybiopsis confluens]
MDVGPNKVSILDTSVLHALYQSAQSFEKDDAYSLGASEGEGLFFIKDRSRHAKRRAIWAQAFTATSIEKYTPYLETCTSKLMTTIMAKSKIGPVDLGRLFNHWAFDLMGLMTFGPSNSFGLLENDDPDHLVENCREAARKSGLEMKEKSDGDKDEDEK